MVMWRNNINNCSKCGYCKLILDFDRMESKRECLLHKKSVELEDFCGFFCEKDITVDVDNVCNTGIGNTYFNTEQ